MKTLKMLALAAMAAGALMAFVGIRHGFGDHALLKHS